MINSIYNFRKSSMLLIIAFFTLSPYYIRILHNIISFRVDNAYFSAISIWQLVVCICFLFISPIKKFKYYKIELVFMIYLVMSVCAYDIDAVSISMLLWIVMPILLSISVTNYFEYKGFLLHEAMRTMLILFTIYCCFTICYNICVKGLFIVPHVRLTSPGGGAVIFGYTIAIYFSLFLSGKPTLNKYNFIIFIVLFFTALSTQSRGAVWPIVAMSAFYIVVLSKNLYNKLLILGCLSGIIVFSLLISTHHSIYSKRIFNTHESARLNSSLGLLSLYNKYPIHQKILGVGLGKFFPYQKWINDTLDKKRPTWDNHFYYDGVRILVQPHNTFLYLLMETGIIGVILFVLCLSKRFFYLCNTKKYILLMFFGTVVFVNLFDSVMIVQPGTASIIWLLIFINIPHNNRQFISFLYHV